MMHLVANLSTMPSREYGAKTYIPAIVQVGESSSRSRYPQIGLALLRGHNSLAHFWSPCIDKNDLIQLHRSLRLLTYCNKIEEDTLCACYYAMSTKENHTSCHYLESLERAEVINAKEIRETILSAKIDYNHFNKFLEECFMHDIPVDEESLRDGLLDVNLHQIPNLSHYL